MSALTLLFVLSTMPAIMAQQPSSQSSISQMSISALLECAANDSCNGSNWDIADELRRRLSVHPLIELYPQQNARVKMVIVDALYTARGTEVESLMRNAAFSGLQPGRTDEDNHYYPLQYLAKLCDQRALKELNRPENYEDSYPISCMQWQATLATFGKCGYKPAIPLLAENLDDACVNNIVVAEGSLRKLIPKSKCWKKAGLDGNFRAESDCYVSEYRAESHP